MNSTTKYIIKTLCLPGMGRTKTLELFSNLPHEISNDDDWKELVRGKSHALQLPVINKGDFFNVSEISKTIISKSSKQNIQLVSFFDKDFPPLLKQINNPPVLLNYKGDLSIVNSLPTIAIIGTRNPTDYGMKMSFRTAELFTEYGFNIVSGLAKGCDTGAHKGCLSKGGKTTAVLAHGLEKVYPRENKTLAQEIVDTGGLLISEYLVGESPSKSNFLERNRIQAGLSLGVLVIETTKKGGTMHTVNCALNSDRVIGILPPPALGQKTLNFAGNQILLNKQLGHLVSNFEDIGDLKEQLKNNFQLLHYK